MRLTPLRLEPLEERTLLAGDLYVTRLVPTGGAGHPFDQLEIRFSKPVQDGSFTLDDLQFTDAGGPIVAAPDALTKLAADRYQLSLAGLTGLATYDLTVGPDILDADDSLPMNQDQDATPGEPEDAYSAGFLAAAVTIDATNTDYDGRSLIVQGAAVSMDGTHALAGVEVSGGSTLTIVGGSALDIARDLLVTGNSTVVCQGKNIAAQVDGQWAGFGVTIHADSIAVEASSQITADGQGYIGGEAGAGRAAGSGPSGGAATIFGGSGGGYGGVGGTANGGAAPGGVYGSPINPLELGSGGGDNSDNNPGGNGGAGGGAIRLLVDHALSLDGRISANGAAGIGNEQGGGAGGSIWITAESLAGTGTITAHGGAGVTGGAGGGGGRIVIECPTEAGFLGFVSAVAANGGGGYAAGAQGTVSFLETAIANRHLEVLGYVAFPQDSSATLGAVTVRGTGTLAIGGGSTINVDGLLQVTENSNVVCQAKNTLAMVDDVWAGAGVTVHAGSVTVDAGSSILADGQGYLGGEAGAGRATGSGPGGGSATNFGGSGGGYGGAGGMANRDAAPGGVYGSSVNPTDLGSGGGDNSDNNPSGAGGAGGGAIRLTATGTITVDGRISANGAPGTGNEQGGGSGGSVYLTAQAIVGSGTIAADGGAGITNGAGGGGGRIALEFSDGMTLPASNITTVGGAGYRAGAMGTVSQRDLTPDTPYVTGVSPRDHTNNPNVQTVTLTLSRPLVGIGARDPATYSLVFFGADRAVGGGDDAELAVTPTYEDGSTLITLAVPAALTEGLYQVTAHSGTDAGLRDPAGQPLDQNQDGFADDLVTTIDVDLTPPVVTGVQTGTSLSFGGDDYLSTRARTWGFSTTATISAWVRTTASDGTVFSLAHDDVQDELLFYVGSGGKIGLLNHKSPGNYTGRYSSTPVNTGEWVFVAGVIDGGGTAAKLHVYVNGVEETGTISTAGSPSDIVDTAPRWATVGWRRNHWIAAEAFQGQIDDVRLWNRALTAEEIQAEMRRPLAGTEPGLAAYWRLDEGTGTLALDSSGNGNDATLARGGQPANRPTWTDSDAPIARNTLRVTYSDVGGIDPVTVVDTSNYRLTGSGGDGTFADGNEVDLSASLASVDYDPSANVATLQFVAPFADDVYRLTVQGTSTVRDLAGNPLGGGADYVSADLPIEGSVAEVSVGLQAASDSGISDHDGLTNVATPTVDVTVDKAGLIEVDFDGDGVYDASRTVTAAGTYDLTAPAALADGRHLMQARFTPWVGTAVTGTAEIAIDTQGPRGVPTGQFVVAPYYQRQLQFSELIDPSSLTSADTQLTAPGGTGLGAVSAIAAAGAVGRWASNGHWYQAIYAPEGIDWATADLMAQAAGGHLATIGSSQENDFVYGLVSGEDAFWYIDSSGNGIGPWLGGWQAPQSSEPGGGWQWVTGETWSYANWAAGEPSNANNAEDRLGLFGRGTLRGATWNDMPSGAKPHGYIVEFDAPPTASTAYTVTFEPVVAKGTYDLAIGPEVSDLAGNRMNQDRDVLNGEADADVFHDSFTLLREHAPGLWVMSVTPAGPTTQPFDTLQVSFSQPLDEGTLTPDDVQLTTHAGGTIAPASVARLDGLRYELAFTGLTGTANYTLTIGLDVASQGQVMDQDHDGTPGEPEDAYSVELIGNGLTVADGSTDMEGKNLVFCGKSSTVDGAHAFADVRLFGGASVSVSEPGITVDGLFVGQGSTFSIAGGSLLTVTGLTGVSGGSTLLVLGKNASGQVDGQWVGVGGTIHAADVVVEAGSKISADAQGYTSEQGPGGGHEGWYDGGGGSHGGRGGNEVAGTTIYGSAIAPTDLGSGGGPYYLTPGGAGGGAIRLDVSGTLSLDGQISADGQDMTGAAGGGSGGSVFVTAESLMGAGTFSADGGDRGTDRTSAGGGGRVAVYYHQSAGFTGFAGSTAAPGSRGAEGATEGTVGFFRVQDLVDPTTDPARELQVFQGFRYEQQDSTITLGAITVGSADANGSRLWIAGGSTVNVGGTVTVTGNSTMLLQGKNTGGQVDGQWAGMGSTIHAANVVVDAGSKISADGQGYTSEQGPGGGHEGWYDGGGASHGGRGGDGVAGTTIYGSAIAPTDLGSGGGHYYTTPGGAGGGAIRLDVSGTLTLNGEITADGQDMPVTSGGGSGGSVFVTAGTLMGSGTFSADGGDWGTAYTSAGGGGRIAVYYQQSAGFTGFAGSTAAPGSRGAEGATEGTVGFFRVQDLVNPTTDPARELQVFQAFRYEQQDATITLGAITVGSTDAQGARLWVAGGSTVNVGGAVTVTGNSTMLLQGKDTGGQVDGQWAGMGGTIHAANVVVDAGSAISADGQGYSAQNGPGGGVYYGQTGGSGYGGGGGAHGGIGAQGVSNAGAGTTIYGSATAPIDLGSGGGNYYQSTGGSGGGAIRLDVSGTLTLNGLVTAKGANVTNTGGGGAGGSIYATVGTLTGSGNFCADGGGL
jgi:hypothetical protein